MKKNSAKKIYVGMSGGVDSSLSAALLVEQGYNVTGVYMKNWSRDLPGAICPWAEDLADAKRVAVQLGIPFKVFDFEKDYKHLVVDYMIREYEAGRTPNPDIMCNQEVKFGLFLQAALEDGADLIATGHYAQIGKESAVSSHIQLKNHDVISKIISLEDEKLGLSPQTLSSSAGNNFIIDSDFSEDNQTLQSTLKKAEDSNKDQTYFLYRVTAEALSKTLFPIGHLTKPQVRKEAEKRGLLTAKRHDSQGICFVGNVGIREFLSQYVKTKPGDIIQKETGKKLGRHDGAIFYTFGQRHIWTHSKPVVSNQNRPISAKTSPDIVDVDSPTSPQSGKVLSGNQTILPEKTGFEGVLGVGGGLPYYVVGKDMKKNEVYVSSNLNNDEFWLSELTLTDIHWINEPPKPDKSYKVRLRHRAPLISCKLEVGSRKSSRSHITIRLEKPERAIAPGQSAVIYDGEVVLGGGIIK